MAGTTDLESRPPTDRLAAPSSVPPNDETPEPTRRIRRSWFGKLFGGVGWILSGPMDWADTKSIARASALIRGLSIVARSWLPRDSRFRLEPDGGFDMTATAYCFGLSVPELQRLLTARRRQTARIAYLMFGLACVVLLTWFRNALMSPWTSARVVLALEFLPFCVLFILIAFYNALINFQIRMRRVVGWREYLTTNEAFWPR
jgi:hypothetical protein